eukprot:gene28739-61530_t
MHECRRDAVLADAGCGKASLAVAAVWRQGVLNAFPEGQVYLSLRRPISEHESDGRRIVAEAQTLLAQVACGDEQRAQQGLREGARFAPDAAQSLAA